MAFVGARDFVSVCLDFIFCLMMRMRAGRDHMAVVWNYNLQLVDFCRGEMELLHDSLLSVDSSYSEPLYTWTKIFDRET